ncbi:MAG TPA: agmatine deiminase family protein [Kofleriaceae bacterium]|nr:agmatine deiminase family protein [Kofleriaceae bacterium]
MSRSTQPAEWQPHQACWLAWPSHGDLWLDNLEPARASFTAMARAIAAGERIEVLAPDAANLARARAALAGVDARFHQVPFGDIWLRDTAPIFCRAGDRLVAARFRFNGWGGKYVLPGDDAVGDRIAALAGVDVVRGDFVLEGGALEVDGEGAALTTEECLLNRNRNPGMSKADYQRALADLLGVDRLLWLRRGLKNDHTDGHVDTIARFVAPGVALCMDPGAGDPNRDALREIQADLGALRLDVVTVPSPGAVTDADGRLLAASYVNFYVGNAAVVVPVYGVAADDDAAAAIAALFPGRTTVPVRAEAILTGGGAFHCITQQQPEVNA